MIVELLAYVGVGVICGVVANLPTLITDWSGLAAILSNRRLLMLLVAQTLLFAGYGLLLAFLQRENRLTTVSQAALLGGAFGLIPVISRGFRTRAQLASGLAVGLSIVACSVAAFILAPIVGTGG